MSPELAAGFAALDRLTEGVGVDPRTEAFALQRALERLDMLEGERALIAFAVGAPEGEANLPAFVRGIVDRLRAEIDRLAQVCGDRQAQIDRIRAGVRALLLDTRRAS
jgi:hypothetical protein